MSPMPVGPPVGWWTRARRGEVALAHVAAALLVAGLVAALYHRALFAGGGLSFRQELLYAPALLVGGFLLVRDEGVRTLARLGRWQLVGIAIFVVGVLLATWWAVVVAGEPLGPTGIRNGPRLILCLGLFATAALVAARVPSFATWLGVALVARGLLFVPFLFAPDLAIAWRLVDPETNFLWGWTTNPATLAEILAISALCLMAWAGTEAARGRRWQAAVAIVVAVFAAATIVLTNSRTHLVVVGAGGAALLALTLRRLGWKVGGGLAVGLALVGSLLWAFVLPDWIVEYVSRRFASISSGTDRIELFRHFGTAFLQRPVGFGLGYESNLGIELGERFIWHPHSFLDVPLLGGLVGALGVALWLAALALAGREAVRQGASGRWPLVLLTALGALWLVGLFYGSPILKYDGWLLAGAVAGFATRWRRADADAA